MKFIQLISFFIGILSATQCMAQDTILESVDVTATMRADGSAQFTENLKLKAPNGLKTSGLTRFLPRRILLGDKKIKALNYTPSSLFRGDIVEAFSIQSSNEGDFVLFGKEGTRLPSGDYTYTLQYTVNDYCSLEPDGTLLAKFYVPGKWNFAVKKTNVRIRIPDGFHALTEKESIKLLKYSENKAPLVADKLVALPGNLLGISFGEIAAENSFAIDIAVKKDN